MNRALDEYAVLNVPFDQIAFRDGKLYQELPGLPAMEILDTPPIEVVAEAAGIDLPAADVAFLFRLNHRVDDVWARQFSAEVAEVEADVYGAQLELRCPPDDLERAYVAVKAAIVHVNAKYATFRARLCEHVSAHEAQQQAAQSMAAEQKGRAALRVSKRFPPEQRNSLFTKLDANEPLKGLTHNPATGDLTVALVFNSVVHLSAFIWDTLGFLDVIDQQQTEAAGQIAALRQEVAALTTQLAPVIEIVRSLGVAVPDWRSIDDVDNGRGVLSGDDVLSAKQAGLLVTFKEVDDPNATEQRAIVRIEPPVGTFVARGSEVLVLIAL